MRQNLLKGMRCWFILWAASACGASCDAAPLMSGFVDGFRDRFNWQVYADDAPDNPHVTPGEFTYVYWQQAIGGNIPLYQILLFDGEINGLGALSATGIIPFTGAAPNSYFAGNWSWNNFTLIQGRRTSSLYVTSPDPPGQVSAFVYNCNPIVCFIGSTPTIGPVNPSPSLGDYDLGGSVGPEDYYVWKAAFGSNNYAADGNRDGIVDIADYTVWRNHFTPLGFPSSVPGPASATLFVIALACMPLQRRRF